MALRLTNFRPVGFDDAPLTITVGDDGLVSGADIAGAEVVDCKGAYLSPGWCDLHVHVWHGGTDISVRASQAGRATGVTAMADAGSAGEAAFHGLREYVIEARALGGNGSGGYELVLDYTPSAEPAATTTTTTAATSTTGGDEQGEADG